MSIDQQTALQNELGELLEVEGFDPPPAFVDQALAEGRELGDVTTLRDPDVMAQLEDRINARQADED